MRLNHLFCKFGDTPWPILCQVLIACLGSFSSGLVIGSTNVPFEGIELCWEFTKFYSSADPSTCSIMDNSLWYFYLTAFSVTACISSFCGGLIITKYGRLKPLIYNNVFYIMGALLTSLAAYPVMFGIGRMISGIACGITFLVVPIYISEITQFNSEKIFCTLHQASVALGILVSSILAIYGSVPPFWRLTHGIVVVPAIIQTILLVNCVETPHYLLSIGLTHKAQETLRILLVKPRRINNELAAIVQLMANNIRRTRSVSEATTQRSGTRQEKTQIDEPEVGVDSSSSSAAVVIATEGTSSSSTTPSSSSSVTPLPLLEALLARSPVTTPSLLEASSTPKTSSKTETPLTTEKSSKRATVLEKLANPNAILDYSEVPGALSATENISAPIAPPKRRRLRASTATQKSEDLEIAEIVYAASSSSLHINKTASSSSQDNINTATSASSVSLPDNTNNVASSSSSLSENMNNIASTSAPTRPQIAETSYNNNNNNIIDEEANSQQFSYDKIWSLSEIIADKHNRNILILTTGTLIFQQLVGINIIIYYSTRIFSHVLSFDINMGANLSVGIMVCYFYSHLLSVFLLNRFSSHRKIFLMSCGSTFVFSILFVIGYGIHVDILAVVAVYGYVVAFSIGFGMIPSMMLVQMTTPTTVASINAFANSLGWMMNVVMGQYLPLLINAIGGYTFAIFAGFAALAIPFGIILVLALFNGGDKRHQFYLY